MLQASMALWAQQQDVLLGATGATKKRKNKLPKLNQRRPLVLRHQQSNNQHSLNHEICLNGQMTFHMSSHAVP
jgi:hypothetical protein